MFTFINMIFDTIELVLERNNFMNKYVNIQMCSSKEVKEIIVIYRIL